MLWKIKVSGTFFISLIFALIVLFITILLHFTGENYSNVFNADGGILELSSNDFKYNILLNGEWRYWDQQFIIRREDAAAPHSLVDVPHSWKGSGFGTYNLSLKGLDPGVIYSLSVPDMSSAYKLYLDSVLIAQNGRTGIDSSSEILYLEPQIVNFTAENLNIEIMLQISNFKTFSGGFINEMKLGKPESIINEVKRNISIQMTLFGGILIIGLYNLSLFLLNTNDKTTIFFALFNFMLAARILLTGERLINTWITNADWIILLKLQFISGASLLGLFALFMNSMFLKHFSKIVVKIILGIVLLLIVAAIFIPMQNLAIADTIFLGASVLFFLYMIFILFRAIRVQTQGSIFAFIGISFILGTIIVDFTLPGANNIIPLGIFIFIIFQSLLIGEKHSFTLKQNKLLHHVAVRDGMTNLYKKDHFRKLVEAIVEDEDPLIQHGMMFIDIDNFKTVNDTYGHDTGDELIIILAQKIVQSLRYSDIASRFGGDEFMVWLHNTAADEAEIIAQRVLDELSAPIQINEMKISVSGSIGLSFYPDEGDNMESLLNICDKRMYTAKDKGRNQFNSGR